MLHRYSSTLRFLAEVVFYIGYVLYVIKKNNLVISLNIVQSSQSDIQISILPKIYVGDTECQNIIHSSLTYVYLVFASYI